MNFFAFSNLSCARISSSSSERISLYESLTLFYFKSAIVKGMCYTINLFVNFYIERKQYKAYS